MTAAGGSHYEVLGVDPGADAAEVRRAYLELARQLHPDAGAADGEAMAKVNEAWAVLGDPEARVRYDATLSPDQSRSFTTRLSSAGFVPVDASDDGVDDDWRYQPDVGDPRTAPARVVVMAPFVLLGLAAAAGIAWFVSGHDAAIAAAVVFGAVGLVAFLIVPLVAMSKASRYENGGP